jgi:O-antigen ligase
MEAYEEYKLKRKATNRYYFRNILIPFLLALSLVIRAAFFQRRREPSAFAEVDFSNLIEIILVLLTILFLISKRGTRAIRLLFNGPLKFYILYIIWCFISTFWSSDIVYSIFRVIELSVTLFIFGYIFIDIRNKEYAKEVLLLFIILSLVAGIGYYLKSGVVSFEQFHSNAYPMLAAAGVIIGFFIYRDRKYFDYNYLNIRNFAVILLAISILGVVLGTSSASNVSLLAAIILLFSLRKANSITFFLLLVSVLLVWIVWENYQDSLIKIVFPGKTLASIESGHGRLGFWKLYINGFLERPIFGYGFPTGEKEGFKYGFSLTSTSHNMLLSVAINTGIIGLVLFSIFIYKYSKFIVKKLRGGYLDMKWIAGVWIVFLVNSLSLPALGSHWMWVTSSAFCVMAYSAVYYR